MGHSKLFLLIFSHKYIIDHVDMSLNSSNGPGLELETCGEKNPSRMETIQIAYLHPVRDTSYIHIIYTGTCHQLPLLF